MRVHSFRSELFAKEVMTTEHAAYLALSANPPPAAVGYAAVPWAALLAERALESIPIFEGNDLFTICQEAKLIKLGPIFARARVRTVFSPHATQRRAAEYAKLGVHLLPFPMCAPVEVAPSPQKDLFYSFVGVDWLKLTGRPLRRSILDMSHPANTMIAERSAWHFDRYYGRGTMSESEQRAQRDEYADILSRSRFSLCPRGFGPGTLRFWESLAAGAIPVLFSDGLDLPAGSEWDQCIVRINEAEVAAVADVLRDVSPAKELEMRARCLAAYRQNSGPNLVRCVREHFRARAA